MFNPAAATSLATMDPERRPRSSGSTASSRTRTGPSQNPNLLVWHGRPGSSTMARRCMSITLARPGRACPTPVRADRRPRAAAVRRSRSPRPTRASRRLIDARPSRPRGGRSPTRGCRRSGGRRRRRPSARPIVRYLDAAARAAAPLRGGRRACPHRRVTCSSTRSSAWSRGSSAGSSSTSGSSCSCRPRRFLGARIVARRRPSRGARTGPRSRHGPAASRGDRADRRRRPDGRADRARWTRRNGSTGWCRRRARSSSPRRSTPGCAMTPRSSSSTCVEMLVR